MSAETKKYMLQMFIMKEPNEQIQKKGRARIKNLTVLAICPQLDKQHESVTKNNVSLAYNRDLTAFNLRVSANFHEKWREQLRF